MAFPVEICHPCNNCGKWTKHRLVGQHHYYLVYECEECASRVLVHMSAAQMFTDFSKCGQPI